jgi:hypothetical protein
VVNHKPAQPWVRKLLVQGLADLPRAHSLSLSLSLSYHRYINGDFKRVARFAFVSVLFAPLFKYLFLFFIF